MAWLFNDVEKKEDNGFVTAYPLHEFFDDVFSQDEYFTFYKYTQEFHERCNSILSYKTVIKPTKRTLKTFKDRKEKMLAKLNYTSLADPQIIHYLKPSELSKIQRQFSNKKMYEAMVGDNDYAQSFLSAEWSYDVYANAMGDLDLTGIISGYLKSIEQLLYVIVQFHKGEGRKIDAKGLRGKVEYTDQISDNEIDTTLHSLKNFLTSYDNKLALDGNIRQALNEAIFIWTTYQRNGYFHKHNLYKSDNKIDDVRNQTIFLYFLILGGFQFKESEINMLKKKQSADNNDTGLTYAMLENWMTEIFKYDLPQNIPGILILLTCKDDTKEWRISPYLLKKFDINHYKDDVWNSADFNHVHNISIFSWNDSSVDLDSAAKQFESCLSKYWYLHREESEKIKAVIFGYGSSEELIHYVPD